MSRAPVRLLGCCGSTRRVITTASLHSLATVVSDLLYPMALEKEPAFTRGLFQWLKIECILRAIGRAEFSVQLEECNKATFWVVFISVV